MTQSHSADASPFPWVGGPSSQWSRDAGARRAALDFGRLHMDGMAALEKLGAPHGGGLAGILVGVIEAYLAEGLSPAPDRARLLDLFEAFRARDRANGASRIAAIHAAAVADPDASPAALAVSSVAASVTAPGPTFNSWTAGYLTGYADAAGSLLGTAGGPLGAASTGISASMLADQLTS